MSKTDLPSFPETTAGASEERAPAFPLATGSAIATLQRTVVPEAGRCRMEPYEVPVRVLAVAEGYAMVRRKGCSPFVLEAKRVRNLSKPNTTLSRDAGADVAKHSPKT